MDKDARKAYEALTIDTIHPRALGKALGFSGNAPPKDLSERHMSEVGYRFALRYVDYDSLYTVAGAYVASHAKGSPVSELSKKFDRAVFMMFSPELYF